MTAATREAARLYRRGVESRVIADMLQVSVATIYNWLQKEGVERNRMGRVDRAVFEEMWRSGATTAEMANAFGITWSSVSTFGGRWGLPNRRKIVTHEEKAAMVEEYKTGAPARAIAKSHGVHRVVVFQAVASAGATRNARGKLPHDHPWRQRWKVG